ncbi:DUF6062 family protein [Anaerocolumna sp. AGMB13020]|uniref:DUF6062 family protein n=1 Tax=Anaerocolumna sp. AGMB13020 TaxID=3081750 RepID=UPI002954A925|nr:DUF6062 family protein [Anaerocolumna sp. AGMB13020]WOO38538.1 DUF6062 family protein [Anaerocolumna sp. AGMB13020]
MKEKLYTIPVNDAFDSECECPVCFMRKTLEDNAVEFTMGPSYMEDDVRAETDKIGFCNYHLGKMYENQNRLGLALMLKTHMDKTIKDLEQISLKKVKGPGLFKKNTEASPVKEYTDNLKNSCYICNKVENTFKLYITTLFSLYNSEESFRQKFKTSKGFCNTHFGLLHEAAPNHLSGDKFDNFLKELNQVYLENMKRVRDDLEWFIDKFDYRYVNEPWKNSKDALPRSMTKTNSTL